MMEFLSTLGNYVASDIRMATPVLFGALGLLIVNRSGLSNIGSEGIMLLGALAAVGGSYYLGNVWLGLLVAIFTGIVLGWLFAFLTVSLRANQIVVGAGFNLLGAGVSATVFRIIFGVIRLTPTIDVFQNMKIPFLGDIPILGKALFNHMPMVYVGFLLVPIISYFLFKTPAGLNLRAVGENPKAADTLGIDVYRTRYIASIVGGVLMSVGGAFLSTGLLRFFTEGIVSGRGFIALAAVVFGKYKPKSVMVATILFAAGNVAANILQTSGSIVPYNFLVMIPYVLTIFALAGFTGKSTAPAAIGKPYRKG